jgi:hypothetical protein
MAKKVTIVRCPACGSTQAGEVGGAYDLTQMQCADCGHHAYADHWQIKFDWNVDIFLPDDATALPRFVAPLDPGDALYASDDADKSTPALKNEPNDEP